jgi:hypothetical protein
MRRLLATLTLALMLAPAARLHAQADQPDQQNPYEYNEDDSQPLKIASYFLAPLGYALEWGVARPLNYLATQTPLAPALNPAITPKYPPTKLADLPPPDKFAPEPYEQDPSKASIPVTPPPPPSRGSPPVSMGPQSYGSQ